MFLEKLGADSDNQLSGLAAEVGPNNYQPV